MPEQEPLPAMPAAALVTRVSRSARWALLESLISAGASTLTVIVLARLLGPAEFGAAGIAMAIAAIVQALLLGGMPDAVARARSVHTAHTDATFWATTAIGALVTLLCAGIGAGIAWAGQPRIGALVAVQGLAAIAVGMAAVPTGARSTAPMAASSRTTWRRRCRSRRVS